jgi:CBS domain-containing protein
MRARTLAVDYPLVRLSDDALATARLMAQQRLPGVVVVDDRGHPMAVLPGSQVLRFLIPAYVQDDPSLARVYDERTADACAAALRGRQVSDLLPARDKHAEQPIVDPDATVMECAVLMARLRSPLLVVAERGTVHGVITASHLLELLLPA